VLKLIFEYAVQIQLEKKSFSKNIFLLISFIKRRIIASVYMKLYMIKFKLIKSKKYQIVKSINKLDCNVVEVLKIKNRNNQISEPVINKNISLKALSGPSPNIYIYFINNSIVFNRSSSVCDGTKIYNNYIYNMTAKHDFKNPIFESIDSFKTKNIQYIIYNNNSIDNVSSNTIHIHMLNEHSNNYYHWLFEIMPKYIKICDIINSSDTLKQNKYILLIDYNLPNQFIEIIDFYTTIKYEIRIIKRFEKFQCKQLLFCTDFWISLDNSRLSSDVYKDYFVDKYAVSLLCRFDKKKYFKKRPIKKLYFERKETQARSLINSSEVRQFLQKENFEVIDIETYSFNEQISLFSEAKIILGVSGAVFSNLIFMQPETIAIILSPNTTGANYYVFQPMADIGNINLIHILTNNHNKNNNIHESAFVDIKEISSVLISQKIK
jgi:hypothetical protein